MRAVCGASGSSPIAWAVLRGAGRAPPGEVRVVVGGVEVVMRRLVVSAAVGGGICGETRVS